MKAFIYPYKPGSESGKALAEGLDLKRIAHKNSRFKGAADKLVINWGASKVPEEVSKCIILNLPQAVAQASDKLKAFRRMNEGNRKTRAVYVVGNTHNLGLDHDLWDDVPDDFIGTMDTARYGAIKVLEAKPSDLDYCRTPEFTDSIVKADMWRMAGHTVVERHILNGNSGAGIRLVEPDDNLTAAPLYVKYVPKKQEYRVHVCGGEAVDVQRKARRKDVEDDAINWKIRNHDNGFIFARNEGDVTPPDVIAQAVRSVNALGLAFGAVDVIFNEKEQKAYVLEVNTAPGLSGSTLEGYLKRFQDYLSGAVALPKQEIPKEFIGVEEDDLPVNAMAFAAEAIAGFKLPKVRGAPPVKVVLDPWGDEFIPKAAQAEDNLF